MLEIELVSKKEHDKVAQKVENLIENSHSEKIDIMRKQLDNQSREIAYLKLRQEASERIEGGSTFADDMKGNEFGIKFNEELSQNAVIRGGGLTMNEYSIVEHNVDDSKILDGLYNTSGNSGRRLIRLDNGALVCAFHNDNSYYLYKSTDNGKGWLKIYSLSGMSSIQDINLATDGIYIYMIACVQGDRVVSRVLKENGDTIASGVVIKSLTAVDKSSLAINAEGTELHACWTSKNSTYPNSYNIQYCKGVIGEGGTVTWGSVEQLSQTNTTNYGYTSPSIMIRHDGRPLIVFAFKSSSYYINNCFYDGTEWKFSIIYNGASYTQSTPSSIFVPKSVNGLENGRIWVAWYGFDATDKNRDNIRVSYSDDNGITWSTAEKLTSGDNYYQQFPSITVNKDNEVFVVWHGYTSTSNEYYEIRQIKWSNGDWGVIEDIEQVSGVHLLYPNTLYDINFKTEFISPLLIYTISATSINFAGSWTTGSYTPTTNATAVYNLPSTDYVGLFVQKEGGINITATINDIQMESELKGDEYQFIKELDVEEDVILKLNLSRYNTDNGDNDRLTRILGGFS